MFVISRFVYDAMGKSKLHSSAPYLRIVGYEESNHKQTYYKFRYGAAAAGDQVLPAAPLTVRKGAFAGIWSLEGFELSERVLGIFGHSSELFLKGLELVHSPFIDPTFRGRLQLGVRNAGDKDVTLQVGDIIGKAVFFDVSDTILSAEDLLQEVQLNAKNKARERAMIAVGLALGEVSGI